MTDAELLLKVKDYRLLTGDYQDAAIKLHITGVINSMLSAGVSEDIARSEQAVDVIAHAVYDIFTGSGSFSPYVNMRINQLRAESKYKAEEALKNV